MIDKDFFSCLVNFIPIIEAIQAVHIAHFFTPETEMVCWTLLDGIEYLFLKYIERYDEMQRITITSRIIV